MELALATFMTTIGFTFAEVLKMLVLVGLNFIFVGAIVWRVRQPLKELYAKFMSTLDSIPKMETSITDLNKTMIENNSHMENRLKVGDDKFIEISSELKKVTTENQRVLRQIAAYSEHIRYLYTKMQLPPPEMGDDETKEKEH